MSCGMIHRHPNIFLPMYLSAVENIFNLYFHGRYLAVDKKNVLSIDLMICQALESQLQLTIQRPALGYNEKQQECLHEPLLTIRTILSASSSFSPPQTNYSTNSKQERPISMTGFDHASRQGVYMMDTSRHGDGDRQTSFVECHQIAHMKKYMTDDSFHGGLQRCRKPGCDQGVEGWMVHCKNHGGGRPCQQLGCLQSAQGSTDLCVTHAGGRHCSEPGCTTAGFGKPFGIKYEGENSCKVEVGGASDAEGSTGTYAFQERRSKRAQGSSGAKWCVVQGCTKGAHGNTPLCIGHGGGKRCVVPGCANAACGSSQGRTDRCVRHGGGKRCRFEGCGKGAQGNTDFCIGHGGGKRCKFEGCGKSAQGRTDFCIRHGGGRRCQFQGCKTSAKWGMDFCSAHRRSMSGGLDASHERLIVSQLEHRARKARAVAASAKAEISTNESGIVQAVSVAPDFDGSPESMARRRQAAITPLVLVPLSGKSSSPSRPVVPAERDTGSRSRALLGL